MRKIIATFAAWIAVGAVTTLLFLALYCRNAAAGDWVAVVWHGLRLDVAVAGYLTVVPGLLCAVEALCRRHDTDQRSALPVTARRATAWRTALWRTYCGVAAVAYSVATVANLVLYGYWGFPLDNTGLLYLRTSPRDAFASSSALEITVAIVAIVVLAAVFYALAATVAGVWGRRRTHHVASLHVGRGGKVLRAVTCLVLTALLIVPIRGGLSTGTNHTGSVYFSTDMRLNHAAVNPVFSFVEAVAHRQDLAHEYRFMSAAEARRLTAPLLLTTLRPDTVSQRPDVVIVMLESFSRYVMRVPGVTPRLNALEREGWAFTRFYASSFRTDRAIVATLSGLPAQPTMSVMDLPRKSTRLPSIAASLSREGYQATFWYGGDADYSNMRSYLIGTGFARVVSEDDFARRERTGKWGVPDGTLLARVLQERAESCGVTGGAGLQTCDVTGGVGIPAYDNSTRRQECLRPQSPRPQSPRRPRAAGEARRLPRLDVVMTGSSHEPFDVPHRSRFPEPELNAFHYTDSCLGAFVDGMKKSPRWANTLLVVLPDHLGAWPRQREEHALWRYQLPLIIAGGAVEPRRIEILCCQKDLAATLLALLGIDHRDFPFSVDALDVSAPHYALYTMNDGEALVTDRGNVVYDNTARQTVVGSSQSLVRKAQAMVQRLYDYLADL